MSKRPLEILNSIKANGHKAYSADDVNFNYLESVQQKISLDLMANEALRLNLGDQAYELFLQSLWVDKEIQSYLAMHLNQNGNNSGAVTHYNKVLEIIDILESELSDQQKEISESRVVGSCGNNSWTDLDSSGEGTDYSSSDGMQVLVY